MIRVGQRANKYKNVIVLTFILLDTFIKWGYWMAQLVEALRYKPEGRGFDSRWSNWTFSVT
jgi:hypothetical protein